MATGDQRAVFIESALLSMSKLGTYGVDGLRDRVDEITGLVYADSGWIDLDGFTGPVDITFTANDSFVVATDRQGVNADGKVLVTNNDGATSGRYPFPNAAATTYYVYAGFAEVPTAIEFIPGTGAFAYVRYKEIIGKTATPTTVVDNGDGTITLTVTNLFPGGGTHAGRKVYVWLGTPLTSDPAGIELCTVAYSGGANKITTTTKLGQTSVSTTAANYTVALLGYTVRTSSSLTEGLFIGTITGNGPAATPTTANITQQDWVFGIGALSGVFEADSHGSVKLKIIADPADTTGGTGYAGAVSQISVYAMEYLDRIFTVDGDGNVKLGLGSGATNAYPVSLSFQNGLSAQNFVVTHNASGTSFASASDRTMLLEGLRVRSNTAGGETALDTAFPKQSWSGTGYQSLLGSMNSLRRSLAALTANVPVSGGTMSSGSSGVTPSSLTAIVNGAHRTITFSTLTPADGTWYVYWNYVEDPAVTTVAPAAASGINSIPAGSILLAKIVRAAGTVTSVLDLRLLQGDDNLRQDILVGDTSAGAHFATLKEAVDFMAEFRVPGTANAFRRKIVVISTTTETSTITLHDGIVIEGASSSLNGSPTVRWAFNDDLFDVTGDGVHIDRLSFESRHTANETGSYTRSLFKFPSGTPRGFFCRQVRLLDGGQGSWAHFAAYDLTSTVANQVVFEDCDFETSDGGLMCQSFTNMDVRNCRIVQAGAAQVSEAYGVVCGDYGKILGTKIEGFSTSVRLAGDRCLVDGSSLLDADDYGITIVGSNCRVANSLVRGDAGGAGVNTVGIDVGGTKSIVTGNDVKAPAGSSTAIGIKINTAPTGNYSIIENNQTNGSGISGTNVNVTTGANNRNDV
jgi:hypothetical protein